jgi:hypothetical protein
MVMSLKSLFHTPLIATISICETVQPIVQYSTSSKFCSGERATGQAGGLFALRRHGRMDPPEDFLSFFSGSAFISIFSKPNYIYCINRHDFTSMLAKRLAGVA